MLTYAPVKRAIDIFGSAFGLILLSPLLLVTALLIRITIGKPILFKQVRPGLSERPFIIYKYRTMTNKKTADGSLLPDKERLPKLGVILRKSSIDELPELWNVLKGDMSLVGPRPLLMQYLMLYNERQRRRHEVRPGITGWAQVNGRNTASWEQKFENDLWYIDNQSFWLDVRILVRTIVKVFIREGISAPGEATMTTFDGSSTEGMGNNKHLHNHP